MSDSFIHARTAVFRKSLAFDLAEVVRIKMLLLSAEHEFNNKTSKHRPREQAPLVGVNSARCIKRDEKIPKTRRLSGQRNLRN